MSHATADHILELIEQLPEEERLRLERRLSERLEAEWEDAVTENRRIAHEQGITDQTIERVIHRRRYGE